MRRDLAESVPRLDLRAWTAITTYAIEMGHIFLWAASVSPSPLVVLAAGPQRSRAASEITVLDVRAAPQDRLQEHRLRPCRMHGIDLGG